MTAKKRSAVKGWDNTLALELHREGLLTVHPNKIAPQTRMSLAGMILGKDPFNADDGQFRLEAMALPADEVEQVYAKDIDETLQAAICQGVLAELRTFVMMFDEEEIARQQVPTAVLPAHMGGLALQTAVPQREPILVG